MCSASKLALTDPKRVAVIIAHRQKRKITMATPTPSVKVPTSRSEPYKMMDDSFFNGPRNIKNPIKFTTLGSIVASEKKGSIPRTANRLYTELTIIEEPYVENGLIIGDFAAPKNFLIETSNKEVCTLQVQGLPDNENALEMFAVGARINVLNASLAFDFTSSGEIKTAFFMVDEREEQRIFPVGRINDMCRYCGKDNAKNSCKNCKVRYCDRECQLGDWRTFKHKLVCQTGGVKAEVAVENEKETSYIPDLANLKLDDSEVAPTEKSYLKDKSRISRILNFRANYNFIFKEKVLSPHRDRFLTFKFMGDMVREMAERPRNTESITLRDMQCDTIYENKTIVLTIIDEPLIGFSYTHFLVEDKNKDVALLAVNGLFPPGVDPMTAAHQQFLYKVGMSFCVMHPFYKLGDGDGLPMIRVDHQKAIQPFLLSLRKDMCTYCGEQNAKMKCSACQRLYCGEECMCRDKDVLHHHLVCETGPLPMTHCLN